MERKSELDIKQIVKDFCTPAGIVGNSLDNLKVFSNLNEAGKFLKDPRFNGNKEVKKMTNTIDRFSFKILMHGGGFAAVVTDNQGVKIPIIYGSPTAGKKDIVHEAKHIADFYSKVNTLASYKIEDLCSGAERMALSALITTASFVARTSILNANQFPVEIRNNVSNYFFIMFLASFCVLSIQFPKFSKYYNSKEEIQARNAERDTR